MEIETTFNFIEGFVGSNAQTQEVAMPVIEKKVAKTNSGKYDADITALTAIYGTTGVSIDIELQELLKICPRDRKRIEAYNGLVSELAKRGIVLTIKSRKTK